MKANEFWAGVCDRHAALYRRVMSRGEARNLVLEAAALKLMPRPENLSWTVLAVETESAKARARMAVTRD